MRVENRRKARTTICGSPPKTARWAQGSARSSAWRRRADRTAAYGSQGIASASNMMLVLSY